VFKNRVVRKIFGPKRECIRLHNEKLYDQYSSPNIIQVIKSSNMRWVGHVTCMGDRRGVYRILVGRPEGKRPFGTPRCR